MGVSKRSSDWPSPRMLIRGSVEASMDCVGGTDGLSARNPLTACHAYFVVIDPRSQQDKRRTGFLWREVRVLDSLTIEFWS